MSTKSLMNKLNTHGCTKKILMSIALIAILTVPIALEAAQGAVLYTVNTFAEITVNPNPAEVNQSVTVNIWTLPFAPNNQNEADNFRVLITAPDGASQTYGPYTTFFSSSTYFFFTPTQVGNYTLAFTYPGQIYLNGTVAYTAANATTTLTVQEAPLPLFPDQGPLPNQYWSAPISAGNKQWYSLTGPFLNNGGLYGAADPWSPDVLTPHIMWSTPVDLGGEAGGPFGATQYYEGSAYEAKGGTVIIIDGLLFHTGFDIGEHTSGGTECFNLQTGNVVWYNSTFTVSFGWEMQIDSGNEHAIIPYLVSTGSTYRFFDPLSGRELFNIANCSTGTNYFTYNTNSPVFPTTTDGTWPGTWFVWTYSDSASGATVRLWNSTKCFAANGWITYQNSQPSTDLAQWAPPASLTATNAGNWSNGLMWTTNSASQYEYIRSATPLSGNVTAQPKSYLSGIKPDFNSGVLMAYGGYFGAAFAGYSMTTGNVLWSANFSDPNTILQGQYCVAGAGFFDVYNLVQNNYIGINDLTGVIAYRTPVIPGGPWSSYTTYPIYYDGNMYTFTYAGTVISNDMKTGAVNWACQTPLFNGLTVMGGANPIRENPVFSADVVYIGNQVKTDTNPMWQNQGSYAINLTDGTLIWGLQIGPTGEGTHMGVADGYLSTYGGYKNEWYVIGRGQSQTSVSATPAIATQGSPVLITGTVLDESPAQPGTPAIGDAYMAAWMQYLHEDQAMPLNATGVPVTLSLIDSNNNTRVIGTATSDISGTFAFNWTPDIPGPFTVIANFAGSNAYGYSSAETHIYASPAPAATATPTATSASMADTYFVPAIAGLFVLIIIVAIVLALLMLRKRP